MQADTIKNFGMACETYHKAANEVRAICLDMFKEICNRRKDKTISLEELNEWCSYYGTGYPHIVYDDSNHLKYDSNPYITLKGFKLDSKSGAIIFKIEDGSDYHIDRVRTSDLIYLCDIFIEYESDGNGWQLGVKDYDWELVDNDYDD